MRAATAVGATAILILVTEVWACTAGAEDAFKPGKWEFWTVGSKTPEPPPGTQRDQPKNPAFPLADLCATARGPFACSKDTAWKRLLRFRSDH
jgi:hypothetical protein